MHGEPPCGQGFNSANRRRDGSRLFVYANLVDAKLKCKGEMEFHFFSSSMDPHDCSIARIARAMYPHLRMNAIRKKIVVDHRGQPREVIIPWSQFREMIEALGLDLDEPAKKDLRAARRDWTKRNARAFKPLSSL
jgi:hypothetical protein